MRYAEHIPGSGAAPTGATRTGRRTLDRLAEAVREQEYWVLHREADGMSWALRELDDTTGALAAAQHVSGPIGGDPGAAMDWAAGLVDVEGWVAFNDDRTAFVDELHHVIRDVARRPRTGRSLVLRVEDDPYTPGLRLVVAREQWTAIGRLSAPLHTRERAAFADDADMLTWASDRFGVDPRGWVTLIDGVDYRHP